MPFSLNTALFPTRVGLPTCGFSPSPRSNFPEDLMTFVTAIGPSQDVCISCHCSEPFSEQFTHGLPCGCPEGDSPGRAPQDS